jgi:hypothetical protein
MSEKAKTYKTLSEFINSAEIKKITDIRTIDELLFSKLNVGFDSDDKIFCKLVKNSLEKELEHKEIFNHNILSDDRNGTITRIYRIDALDFKKKEINKLGDGFFTIPFTCEIHVNIVYFCLKSIYYCLDEEEKLFMNIENYNEHYFRVEENFHFSCNGKIWLQFEADISKESEISQSSFSKLIKDAKIDFSELEYE